MKVPSQAKPKSRKLVASELAVTLAGLPEKAIPEGTVPRKAPMDEAALTERLQTSEPLQQLLGHSRPISRPRMTKEVWDYILAKDLHPKAKKPYILPDGKLRALGLVPKRVPGFE